MKPHTPDQVTAMKKFADSQPSAAERKTFELNGLQVTYTTVDMGEAKPFDYAVAAFVAPREDGEPITEADYEIAVSNDVPEELQGIWAWHELHDFDVVGHEADNRCLRSEQELAAHMSSDPDLYQRYLAVRIPFYDGLAVFIATDLDQKGDGSVYSSSDLQGCYDAIAFLQKKMNELQAPEETVKPSILDLAKAKRTEIDLLAAQDTKRQKEAAEEARIAQEKQAEINAELKRESDDKATEFIKLMKTHKIPTTDFYGQLKTLLRTSKGAWDFEGHYETDHWYKVEASKLGKGWVLSEKIFYQRGGGVLRKDGYFILESGETYPYSTDFIKPKGYEIVEYTGIELENGMLSTRSAAPLEAPFANEGEDILIAAILRFGVDKPPNRRGATSSQQTNPIKPSPTSWVGRPNTR